jgi:hypothetical protein
VFAYLYLIPYGLLVQRPKTKRTYKRFGLIFLIFLLAGLLNCVINILILPFEKVSNTTFTAQAWLSCFVVIGLFGTTLGIGFFIYSYASLKSGTKIAAADEDGVDDLHFNKGKTADEQKAIEDLGLPDGGNDMSSNHLVSNDLTGGDPSERGEVKPAPKKKEDPKPKPQLDPKPKPAPKKAEEEEEKLQPKDDGADEMY